MSAPPWLCSGFCCSAFFSPSEFSVVVVCRGNGRMNCGCCRATSAMRWYVSSGITAHMERGLFACRSRHSTSISLVGSSRIFSILRYELSGLMLDFVAWRTASEIGESGLEMVDGAPFPSSDPVSLVEAPGGVGIVTVSALRLYSSILSRYACSRASIDS